jgi:protein AroM
MEESGALDDLDANAIRSLAPAPGARQLVSRLSSGDEVHLDADAIEERLVRIANDRWRKTRPDFIVVLCTGEFPRIEVGCPLVSSGKIVDSAVDAFSRASSRTGVLVPHPSQMEGFRDRFRHPPFLTSYASPYSGDRFEKAAQELEECDLVIMHCMGYDEEMRERVSRVTEKPVLLARRLVAAAVAQLL